MHMCTAISYKTNYHYFGRSLDLDVSYKENIAITPRNYNIVFKKQKALKNHYAIIGTAMVMDDYPFYYEATNEKGLSIAGLNFPGNAYYGQVTDGKYNIAPYELIPFLLGQCKNIYEVKQILANMNIVDIKYCDDLPLAELHWIIADADSAITLESVRDGIKIYDNKPGILTNNPSFDFHMANISNYMNLTSKEPDNRLTNELDINSYSKGMGSIGLPGDYSSVSRFIKALFVKFNSLKNYDEISDVTQFFHILGSVEMQKGCVDLGDGKYEYTVYISCCNTDKGIYYYKTYENSRICCVDMHKENLDNDKIIAYPFIIEQDIYMQNTDKASAY